MDVDEYISKANQQLTDGKFYRKLKENPTRKHSDIVNNAIESFKKQELLSTSITKKLFTNDVRTPQFHILPKIHKPNIPGRPVVSSAECHTCKISKFFDHYLKRHAEAQPSYIKDTADFINKINRVENTTKDTFLVTLDVKSLYINIPNHEGIETAKEALNLVPKKPIPTKAVIKFLFLILTLSNFILSGIHYLQKPEYAMGTRCAPYYTNIFKGKLERNLIYPCLQTFSDFYCRFADDIFLLWNGSQTQLLDFITRLILDTTQYNLILNIQNTASSS